MELTFLVPGSESLMLYRVVNVISRETDSFFKLDFEVFSSMLYFLSQVREKRADFLNMVHRTSKGPLMVMTV